MTINECGDCPALTNTDVPRCSFWLETIRMCWDVCEFMDKPELLAEAIEKRKDWKGIYDR